MGRRRGRSRPARVSRAPDDNINANSVLLPIEFVRQLVKQTVYDPRKTAGQPSYSYSIYTKENILRWIQSPSSSEKNLRDASNYMYLSSMHYQRLIKYYAGLYTGAYVISPVGFDRRNVNPSVISRQFYQTSKMLELLNVPDLLQTTMNVALREGAFYGVKIQDGLSVFVQKINPDYCKITSVMNGTFLYAVDCTKIGQYLEYYPPIFATLYSQYLSSGQKWQEVPSDFSFCIKADKTIQDYSIPPFAAVMPELYTIANTESLQETADELSNYKMITGLIPTDDKGNPTIPYDIVQKYYAHIQGAIGDNVGLALSPFTLSSFNFEQGTGTGEVDKISQAVGNFWQTAGSSGLLHGIANDTAGVTKLAIKNDETFVLSMVQQFEGVINRILKVSGTGSVKFKVTMLPITVFNKEEMVKQYKEAAAFGIGKSYYCAAIGIPQYDVAGLDYLEKNVIAFEDLTPLKSSYNSATDDVGAGRPAMDDTDLGEEGASTRDNDTNANR